MGRRKLRKSLPREVPLVEDRTLRAFDLLQRDWVLLDEGWYPVLELFKHPRGCTGFGRREWPVLVSFRQVGEREFNPEDPLTVRRT